MAPSSHLTGCSQEPGQGRTCPFPESVTPPVLLLLRPWRWAVPSPLFPTLGHWDIGRKLPDVLKNTQRSADTMTP